MAWNPAATRVTLLSTALLWAAAGCGGGGSRSTDIRAPILLTIESDGARDGFVRSDGFTRTAGNQPGVGDLDAARLGLGLRMFYTFPLHRIPADAVITSVTLRVYQLGTHGLPFVDLGRLVVDHIDPGESLDPADYHGGTLEDDIGTLSHLFERNYASLAVEDNVKQDLEEGRPRSWFRLRFSRDSNLDGETDVLNLNDGENSRGLGNLPLLEVVYTRP